ncbi:MAG: hypothetical protein ACTHME_00240, partial [Candidatus Nitrosocosmicus sp.]
LLISTTVFTFAILLPYVWTLGDKHDKEKDLYDIKNSFDYIQSNNYSDAIKVINNLNNSMTNSILDLRYIVSNINLHQIQLQIQNLSKKADLQLHSESERNVVTSTYKDLKHFSSFFTIPPPVQSIMEEQCSIFAKSSNAYNICIWKNVITNNSKSSSIVNYTLLTSPFCNEQFPGYTTDLFESNKWADCILNEKFHNYLHNLNNVYLNYTLNHNPNSKIQKLIGFKQFDLRFRAIINDFNSTLPLKLFTNHSLTVDSQIQNANLDSQTMSYTNAIVKKFDPLIESLSSQIFIKQDNLSKILNKTQGGIDEKQKELDAIKLQLNKIQFPLGSIPLDLNTTIVAFPVGLSIFFVIYTVIYKKAVFLRNVLKNIYYKTDREKTIFNDKTIPLIAPLWLDASHSNKDVEKKEYMIFIGKLIVFILPIIFFIIQCLVMYYGFHIYDNPNEPSQPFEKVFEVPYTVLYFGFCIGLFFYGIRRIKMIIVSNS